MNSKDHRVSHGVLHESRVGDVWTDYSQDGRRRVVVEVCEKELLVAKYSGLLIDHPHAEKLIYWGPFREVCAEGVTSCTVTKNTEPDLRNGSEVVYSHDDHADIQFKLKEES